MVKQFLRRIFSTRKTEADHLPMVPEEREEVSMEHSPLEEIAAAGEWITEDKTLEVFTEPTVPPTPDPPFVLMITREKIEQHNYKEAMPIISEALEAIQMGLRRSGRIQLSLDPSLVEEMDEFLGKRIGKYIDLLEQQSYDLTAFLDWDDEETRRLYTMYVVPPQPEKQDVFIKSRLLLIYDTSEAIGWDYRLLARNFAEVLDIILPDSYFVNFEAWLRRIDDECNEESNGDDQKEAEEDRLGVQGETEDPIEEMSELDFSHMIPIQISRDEVEREDISAFDRFFDRLEAHEIAAKKEKVVFSFYGFAGEVDDLVNNPMVNMWASLLVEKYPYLFYFLNDRYVPMTSFLTSLVVTTQLEGETVCFNMEELKEFLNYISDALCWIAQQTGEDENELIAAFKNKLKF